MVHSQALLKRLAHLQEYLDFLERQKACTFQEFISDPKIYGSVERFLHLAIEALLDMGNHVIADEGYGQVNWYSDIPARLQQHNILTEAQKNIFISMIGFRNTLVHEYIEIDRKIVYDILQNHIPDLRDLAGVFAKML